MYATDKNATSPSQSLGEAAALATIWNSTDGRGMAPFIHSSCRAVERTERPVFYILLSCPSLDGSSQGDPNTVQTRLIRNSKAVAGGGHYMRLYWTLGHCIYHQKYFIFLISLSIILDFEVLRTLLRTNVLLHYKLQ